MMIWDPCHLSEVEHGDGDFDGGVPADGLESSSSSLSFPVANPVLRLWTAACFDCLRSGKLADRDISRKIQR